MEFGDFKEYTNRDLIKKVLIKQIISDFKKYYLPEQIDNLTNIDIGNINNIEFNVADKQILTQQNPELSREEVNQKYDHLITEPFWDYYMYFSKSERKTLPKFIIQKNHFKIELTFKLLEITPVTDTDINDFINNNFDCNIKTVPVTYKQIELSFTREEYHKFLKSFLFKAKFSFSHKTEFFHS